MNFEEDLAIEAYQNALTEMEAFRPTYEQTLAVQPLNESGQVATPKPGGAEIHQRWLALVAEVEATKAELDRVRGD